MPASQAISPPRLSPGNLSELITLLAIQVQGLSGCLVS
jgi:AraC family transcriptional activator of mtrCDE